MKQAIITGATGFIGSKLVKELIASNIDVIALGRKDNLTVFDNILSPHEKLTYIQIDMDSIAELDVKIKEHGIEIDLSCVFYNFAWWGKDGLSDLDVSKQLSNVVRSQESFNVAEKMGCARYIHVGTMEEVFTDKYLELDYHKNQEYNRHIIYSMAKIIAKNHLKALSIDSKVKLIIGYNSHVMGPGDSKDSFLQVTLEKLVNGDELLFSTGEQYFDVISARDCARAYKALGETGKSNQEYWIGSGEPKRLRQYVEIMAKMYPTQQELGFGKFTYNDISLQPEDFSIENLNKDTDFKHLDSFEDAVRSVYKYLFSN
jgi:nucleoside-diphosphate-sugar epimerase